LPAGHEVHYSILQDAARFAIIKVPPNLALGIVAMQIIGMGTEIVECLRIGQMIERHGELFLTRVYTVREIQCCRAKKQVTEQFAERWAAKEAIVKCLGTGWRRGLNWTDIEVRHVPEMGPKVYLCGSAKDRAIVREIGEILLTMAHCRAYATATAIAVKGDRQ